MENNSGLYYSVIDENGNVLGTILYQIMLDKNGRQVIHFTKLIENSRFKAMPQNLEQFFVQIMINEGLDTYVNPGNDLYENRVELP